MKDGIILIVGKTTTGQKFRPSEWAQRIASPYGEFVEGRKFVFNEYIRPILYDDISCLLVDKRLMTQSPDVYVYLMNFAGSNNLIILDDRVQVDY